MDVRKSVRLRNRGCSSRYDHSITEVPHFALSLSVCEKVGFSLSDASANFVFHLLMICSFYVDVFRVTPSAAVDVDPFGQVQYNGFYGIYDVTVELDDMQLTAEFE